MCLPYSLFYIFPTFTPCLVIRQGMGRAGVSTTFSLSLSLYVSPFCLFATFLSKCFLFFFTLVFFLFPIPDAPTSPGVTGKSERPVIILSHHRTTFNPFVYPVHVNA